MGIAAIAGDCRYLSEGSMGKLHEDSDAKANAAIESGASAPRITSKPTTQWDAYIGPLMWLERHSDLGVEHTYTILCPKCAVKARNPGRR